MIVLWARQLLGLLILWLAIVGNARAAVILMDFSASGGTGGPGGTWNAYAQPSNLTGTLVDSTGANTGVSISISGNWTNSGNAGTSLTFDNDLAAFAGLPAWATAAGASGNGASGDLFYTSNASDGLIHQGILTFANLPVGYAFTLNALGSRNVANADGFYDVSLDGGTNYSGFTVMNGDGTVLTGRANTQAVMYDNQVDGYQNHRYISISGVLTGSTLNFRMTDISNANGNFAALNAMQFTLTPVPEPSTWVFLIASFIGVLRIKRLLNKQNSIAAS